MLNSMAVGQRPGFPGQNIKGSAEGAIHRSGEAGQWPAIDLDCTRTQGVAPLPLTLIDTHVCK